MDCASFLKSLIQTSDFGFGFFVFGCFSQVFNLLGLFLLFCLGLKILQFSLCGRGLVQFLCDIRCRSSHHHINDESGSKIGLRDSEECDAKIMSCKCGPLKFLENSESQECCEEDFEFDVLTLRRLVKIEKQRASLACMELEKERMAASSAAEETMAMILRLQNEKSATEIEANQYRILAEKKQEFDKEVIESLQWIVMRHESERFLLEEKLMSFRQKLKQYVVKDDELVEFEGVDHASMSEFSSTLENVVDDDMDTFVL
ncbi:hypothetical protein Dsin_032504 [Dipteronia sinensis]|uniref:GTD-binding domain-containing protein n=1 Tax=Dipteronia sinensis TaxID=43782 RepID=A0AAD9ZNY6_9ROSI|nr:hypothetical protein Dsin_032504 [Dipteronia sinensis]